MSPSPRRRQALRLKHAFKERASRVQPSRRVSCCRTKSFDRLPFALSHQGRADGLEFLPSSRLLRRNSCRRLLWWLLACIRTVRVVKHPPVVSLHIVPLEDWAIDARLISFQHLKDLGWRSSRRLQRSYTAFRGCLHITRTTFSI